MSETELAILWFAMIYVVIHSIVINCRNFGSLTLYQKVIVISWSVIIVLLMLLAMDL